MDSDVWVILFTSIFVGIIGVLGMAGRLKDDYEHPMGWLYIRLLGKGGHKKVYYFGYVLFTVAALFGIIWALSHIFG